MNYKITIFSLLVIFTFSFILWEANKIDKKFGGSDIQSAGTVVKVLPDLKFNFYEDNNKFVNLHEYTKDGKNVFVHFWATWCVPCEQEFPELVDMLKILKDKENVKFLLVAVNDDRKKMAKFLKRFDLNYPNVVLLEDNTNAHKDLGTYKMPETFLFNSQNKIVKKFTGQQPWTQKYIIDMLKAL